MPLADVFGSMLMFFLFLVWVWLVISILIDVFRQDRSGWWKAAWTVVVIVVPLLGVIAYLIAHGGEMQRRSSKRARGRHQNWDNYLGDVQGPVRPV